MPALRSAIALALIVVSVLASSVFAADPAPRSFAPEPAAPSLAASDARWDDRFGMEFSRYFYPGDVFKVAAAAVFQGELYVAGTFNQSAEYSSFRNIARWNGRQWNGVGAGSWSGNDSSFAEIYDLVVYEDRLYATGSFTKAAGVPARNIARWDGSQWSALGDGLDAEGEALAVFDGDLYVGGLFFQAGGVVAEGVARWGGGTWHAAGAGLQQGETAPYELVTELLATPEGLYAGGDFARSGAQEMHTLARWDGSQWSAVIPQLSGQAFSLDWHNGAVYVAGTLALGGATPTSGGLLRWDGAQSQFLTSGLNSDTPVWTVRSVGGELYASQREKLYRWNGLAWELFGPPLVNAGWGARSFDMLIYNDTLHLAGNVGCARAGCDAEFALAWDGADWHGLGEGVFTRVNHIAVVGGALYVGAERTPLLLGSKQAPNLGMRDATGWHDVSIPTGGGNVSALVGAGSSIYAAFQTLDGPATIYRRDGAGWTALPGAFNGLVNTLAYTNGVLYAGGDFSTVGAVAARDVARWDGAAWSALGDVPLSDVTVLAVHAGAVYAAGPPTANNFYPVVRWDGAGWTLLGTADYYIRALTVAPDGTLYVGGLFHTINGVDAKFIARLRAGAWEALPHDLNGSASGYPIESGVHDLAMGPDGAVYVGGAFASAGTPGMKGIARYDGTWHALGSGVDSAVVDMEMVGQDLYLGGKLFKAGDKSSEGVAIWHGANAAPQAVADTASARSGHWAAIAVLANDKDANHDDLTITSVTAPSHGVAQVVGGAVRYTPAVNFIGSDGFSYAISDGVGGSDSASVTVTVFVPTSAIFLPAVVR
jgi:hypothetical protein